jgi:DNA (cytosine-5)-methyltransferase 1
MRVLDLCSGIGGFSLGLQRAGMETVAFCEIDEFCRKILNKHWPDVPVFKDIKALANGSEGLIPECDLICGGVPCQPFSVAGKQEGQGDTNRHLWPYMFEIVKQQKPAFVIVENVAGFVNMALDDVLSDLESEGYAAQSFVIPACAVDAKHRRDRVWIVAYSDSAAIWHRTKRQEIGRHNVQTGRETVTAHDGEAQFVADTSSKRLSGRSKKARWEEGASSKGHTRGDVANANSEWQQQSQGDQQESRGRSSDSSEDVADSDGARIKARLSGQKSREKSQSGKFNNKSNQRNGWEAASLWPTEPRVGRVADGVPNRVDRIKGLGNAVVPQVVEVIGRAIMEFYEESQSKNQS